MTATQNNFLGPAALIFSCCFPAKDGWESENCGLSAAHELTNATAVIHADNDCSPRSFLNRIRREAVVCGGSGRITRPTLRVF
jgi:hypothetical protein